MTVSPTSAVQPGDGAGLVGLERLLHLHRLEDDDEVALGDLWPSSTATLTMVPCIGAVSESPEAAAPDLPPPDRLGAFFCAAATAAAATERRGRRAATTSRRLPPTSTTTVWRSSASSGVGRAAGVRLDLVVELGLDPAGVDGERPRRRPGAKAGSRTTARWNGMTVGMPSTDELGERAARALERLVAVAAGDDELGDQRVERAGDGLALDEAAVDAHARALRRDPCG